MGKERITLRIRPFVPEKDGFENLLKINSIIYRDPMNHVVIEEARQWCSVNPNIFKILVDDREIVHAYSAVIPVTDALFDEVMKKKTNIYRALKKDYVLSEKEAKEAALKSGNSIIVDMEAYNPQSRRQDYDFAASLFGDQELLFFRHRARQLLTCSISEKDKAITESNGCIRLFDLPETKDGVMSVYYFGPNQIKPKRASGFGVVMSMIWGDEGRTKILPLDLAARVREVLKQSIDGYTDKEIAAHLKISLFAVEAAWKRAVAKGQGVGLPDRKILRAYVAHNSPYFL
jgi:hypothetical protein